jgi:hypothetical protein
VEDPEQVQPADDGEGRQQAADNPAVRSPTPDRVDEAPRPKSRGPRDEECAKLNEREGQRLTKHPGDDDLGHRARPE